LPGLTRLSSTKSLIHYDSNFNQILAKGPQISIGYRNDSIATAETFSHEGFLRTGDLGSIDDKGLITIHDRIKELIKVSFYYIKRFVIQ
jgi:long-subunit acyl-CoA synthetase (AMP-forming)